MNQTTNSTIATRIMTIIKATDAIATITNLTIVIKTIDTTIILVATI
jgi:hypothetical protein